MAYGKNLKPLVVGFPLEVKKQIEVAAKENNISEAEVVRRICDFLFQNESLLNSALNKNETEIILEEARNNCNPARFIKFE